MSAVVDVVSDVGEAIGDAVESVGSIAESAVREIGKGAESLGREIGKVGQAAINDPVGTIAKVGAIVTQQYWALPLISAATVVANGGDLGQAAMAAGISYAGMYIASGISDYLASGSESALMGVENAADGSTIFSYSDGSSMIQTADGLTKFTNPTTITGSLNTALSNAAGNMATTALRGGDLNQILTSGLTGGAGTYVGLETTQGLKDIGLAAPIANVLGSTSGAVTRGVLSGQDAGQIFNTALINNIISTSLAQTGDAIKKTDVYKGLQKSVNETINSFKDSFNSVKQNFLNEADKNDQLVEQSKTQISNILNQSNSLKEEAEGYKNNTLLPSQELAQNAYNAAKSSYDSYKTTSDEFSSLVKQYDEAKAAGDTELANSLADKANALIPTLNAATDKYNADYTSYETAKSDFESKTQFYTAYNDKFKQLDDQYAQINKQLEQQYQVTKNASNQFNDVYNQIQENANATAKQVDSAYETASKYAPVAKDAFEKLYLEDGNLNRAVDISQQVNGLSTKQQNYYDFSTNFGLRPEDALKFAPDVSKMSVIAQQSFYDELSKNPDLQNAMAKATELNSLTDEQRASYDYAKKSGLDYTSAINTAKIAGGLTKQEQDAYINTYKQTGSPELSGLFSFVQALSGDGTQLTDPYTTNLNKLQTTEGKEAYQIYLNSGIPESQAFAMAQGQDQAIAATGTGTLGAGPGSYLPGQGTVTVTQAPSKYEEIGQKLNELDTKLQTGQITKEDYDKQVGELTPQPPVEQPPTQYTTPDQTYFQNLIDQLFTGKTTPVKTLATTTAPAGTGTTTPTQPSTGATGTQPGTGTGGGTQPSTGGAGGTQGGTGDQTGTGGTGTGSTGTGTGAGGTGGGGGTGTGIGGGIGLTAGLTGTGGYGYGYNQLLTEDQYGGIKNLSPGLTQRMEYTLSGAPNIQEQINPMMDVPQFATGGSSSTTQYDPFSADISGIKSSLSPGLTKAQLNYILTGLPGNLIGKAEGGLVHNPEFFSEGGLGSIENRYVKGNGDGTSDSIPAMLANGEFVIPADVVSSLGNGSNDAGAEILDEFLKTIRKHKRAADERRLPPDSKGPLAYLLDAKRKVKA